MTAGVQRVLNGKRENASIFVLDIASVADESSKSGPVSFAAKFEQQITDAVRSSSAPVVWIAGNEPLSHPQIGQLTRMIANCGRYVFVETDGTLLRRRIHEFQPGPRLFFSVKLDRLEPPHDRPAEREGTFRLAIEGVRTARLSGFLICAQTRIFPDTNIEEIARLREFLQTAGVDGWVITALVEAKCDSVTHGDAMRHKVKQARLLIANRRWEKFSELVETAQNRARPNEITSKKARTVENVTDACEESVQV